MRYCIILYFLFFIIALNSDLTNIISVQTDEYTNVEFSANGNKDYAVSAPNGYTLLCAIGSCWDGRIICTNYKFDRVAFINLTNSIVSNRTLVIYKILRKNVN